MHVKEEFNNQKQAPFQAQHCTRLPEPRCLNGQMLNYSVSAVKFDFDK